MNQPFQKITGFILALVMAQNLPALAVMDSVAMEPVRLEDLLVEAESRNPQIIAAKAEWEAAKKRIVQSWALPDPMAGYDIMGEMTETRVGPQEQRFMISQKIPFPLKLWQRRKMAKKEAEAAEQRYLITRRDILNEVRQSFYDLFEIDESIEVIEEIHALLKRFEASTQVRYASLHGAHRDVAKAQAEVSLTLEQLFIYRQKRESLIAFINYLLNRSPMDTLGKAEQPTKPLLEQTFIEWINLAMEKRQEIKEMEAMVQKSNHAKKLARLEYIPDIDVGFTYTVVGGGETMSMEDGKDSWMIPVSINIPLWQNRLIPAIQEAQKEIEAARAKLEDTRNETFYEVKDAYVKYKTAIEITKLYETGVVPQAQLALVSDQAGYEAGETDFLNLLDSERIYLNVRQSYIKIYVQLLKGAAALERAAGLDLSGMS